MSREPLRFESQSNRCTLATTTGFQLSSPPPVVETVAGKKRSPRKTSLNVKRLSPRALEVWHTHENGSDKKLHLSGIRLFDGTLAAEGAGWCFLHPELFKGDRYFGQYDYLREALRIPLENLEGEFGLSEDFPFPGAAFTHPERGTVLLAVLTQNRAKPVWRLSQKGRNQRLEAAETFFGVPHLTIDPGQRFESEHWLLLFHPDGVEAAVEEYFTHLKKRFRFVGARSILRRAVVWGSWNYNPRPRGKGDIDHRWIAANAKALRRLAPDHPRFVMIDDGYQPGRSRDKNGPQWFASAFEYFFDPSKPAWDPVLFPQGMKGIADAIRKAGCEPALWITPRLQADSELARQHPDWLVRVGARGQFPGRSRFLDYSLPEVRDYICGIWRTVFQEWGFQGIKMDFWSYPYEVPGVRFRKGTLTSIEWRTRFLKDLRSFVPKDGYVITGCATNSGNPFLGRHIDAARNARDIGYGTWEYLRESATWLGGVIPFYRHDALLSDADSIGWCDHNTQGENRLWATVALMTGAVCEIGGDLPNLGTEARRLLKHALEFFKPSRRTLTPSFETAGGSAAAPPHRLVLERDDGIYEAYFNWALTKREVILPQPVRELWTGKKLKGRVLIPPHDVIWFKRSDRRRPR